jgi:hypothetical protein
MITLEQAKQLKPGDILINEHGKRWRVNGQVKTWKTDNERIRVPLKHGLYAYDALETHDFIPDGKCSYMTLESEYAA